MTMVGEVMAMRLCHNETCMQGFVPTRHNQKYCSTECRKKVTNAKIMRLYYEEKDRKAGKERICTVCNVARLSRYNAGTICSACVAGEQSAKRKSLLEILGTA